jgi:2-succinyl-6-hydroxy-2,4-cyclohexadiene-1-carboxylate synthase
MLTTLHGFTETDESWSEVLQPLPGQKRFPLLPGHGWNPCPAGTTIASCAAAIAATLPTVGDLMGYSMGGRVALQLALDFPEKVGRLVLVSSTAGLSDPVEIEKRKKFDAHYAEVLLEDGIGTFVSWWESNEALKPVKPFSRNLTHHLRCRRLNQDPIGLAHALLHLGTGVMPELWSRLGELKMPVMLIAGACDVRYVEVMKRMAERIPQARLEVVNESGHAVHREQPHALLELLKSFLN